jgi:HD-GYP domain-containing protein (c-di-GMP phosphodiesterase class II)
MKPTRTPAAPVLSGMEAKAKPSFVVFTGPAGTPSALAALGSSVEFRPVGSPARADPGDLPGVLILSGEMDLSRGLADLPAHVVVLAADEDARRTAEREGRLFLATADVSSDEALLRALRSAARLSWSLLGQARASAQLGSMTDQIRQLNRIGMALMGERDTDVLLGLILTHARSVTGSDAGSLYLVESGPGAPRLRFLRAQNDSLPEMSVRGFTLPIDSESIAGYAASTGEPVVIDDVYELPAGVPYAFNPVIDEMLGYRAKSMLTVPMTDHRDRVVGVLQLINRKATPSATIRSDADAERHVLPYTQAEVDAVWSLAGQAAVSVENGKLYQDIENLFEGFIKAAVTAIDQRDPTTSGHSVRVAALTCDLAATLDRATDGPFEHVRFSREQMRELRYAGLLHDFGKVGVREEVLTKPKKLPALMFERIRARFDLIEHVLHAEFHKRKAERLLERGREGYDSFMDEIEDELRRERERLRRFQAAVVQANEPYVTSEAASETLREIARLKFRDASGAEVPYIEPEALHFLSIAKGSLDPEERLQIQSHVLYTYDFLRQIPWTENLSRVADIALGHHEKLDGTGYPRGVRGSDIPLQTRMMTVSDIFDALTSSDRPYMQAYTLDEALDTLRREAEATRLDPAVVQAFVESRIYERILQQDWRTL